MKKYTISLIDHSPELGDVRNPSCLLAFIKIGSDTDGIATNIAKSLRQLYPSKSIYEIKLCCQSMCPLWKEVEFEKIEGD